MKILIAEQLQTNLVKGIVCMHILFDRLTVYASCLICILNAASSQESTSSGKAIQSHHLETDGKASQCVLNTTTWKRVLKNNNRYSQGQNKIILTFLIRKAKQVNYIKFTLFNKLFFYISKIMVICQYKVEEGYQVWNDTRIFYLQYTSIIRAKVVISGRFFWCEVFGLG